MTRGSIRNLRKPLFAVAVLIGVLIGVITLWRVADSRTYQVFGDIIPRVETAENVVALTFDDGPTPVFTDEILQILTEENVTATFFLIGGELEHHPADGQKIAAAGHEIGNHTYSHKRMILVTPSFVRSEIEKTDDLIQAVGYDRPTHFRPPYGNTFLKRTVRPSCGISYRKAIRRWPKAPRQ